MLEKTERPKTPEALTDEDLGLVHGGDTLALNFTKIDYLRSTASIGGSEFGFVAGDLDDASGTAG